MTDDVLLSEIKAIVAEELPKNYRAKINLVFGNLCEGQEDNFKLIIDLFYRRGARSTNGRNDWVYRIGERIHTIYGEGLLISTRMPEAVEAAAKKLNG